MTAQEIIVVESEDRERDSSPLPPSSTQGLVNLDEGDASDDDEIEDSGALFQYSALDGYEPLSEDDGETKDAAGDVMGEEDVTSEATVLPMTVAVEEQNLINQDDLETIKSVMASFPMPESAIPDWAKAIPEETWLPKLVFVEGTPTDTRSS
ncbi:hypothetical protein HKX48_009151 [Thoreauomyces humboldtii]|nr:hypothetical protein HKX48_009151 [Thoreauomyces humboldtii]